MKLFSTVLCLAFLAPCISSFNEKELLSVARSAEGVVVAEVVETHPSLLSFWSGMAASVQRVRYKVVEVLKGEVKSTEIDAGHYVVYNSLTADKEQPRFSPELFKPGNRLILVLSRERGHGCKLENPEGNIEAFCSPQENYSAVLAKPKLVDKLRQSLKRK